MAKTISVPGSVTLSSDVYTNVYNVDFHLDIIDGLQINQINSDGTICGLKADYTDYHDGWTLDGTCDTCDVALVIDIKRARIVNGISGTTYSLDTSKTDGDILNNDTDLQDLFNTLRDDIKLSVDTHWNCYCKRIQVCGCGCDPKHDGW